MGLMDKYEIDAHTAGNHFRPEGKGCKVFGELLASLGYEVNYPHVTPTTFAPVLSVLGDLLGAGSAHRRDTRNREAFS